MIGPRHLLAATVLLAMGACAALEPAPPLERDASHRLERGLGALQAGHYREAFEDLSWVYAHCTEHTRGAEALVGLAALELDPRNEAGRPGLGTELVARIIRDPAPADYVRPFAETAYLMALGLGAPEAPGTRRGAPETLTEQPAAPVPDTVLAGVPDTLPAGVPDTIPAGVPDTLPAGVPDSAADAATPPPPAPHVRRTWEAVGPPGVQAETVYGCGERAVGEGWVPPPLPALPGPSLVAQLVRVEEDRDAARMQADSLRRSLEATRQRLAETEAELERIRRTLKP